MAEPQSALDAGLELARCLERRGLPCALGGALALGVWGVPRGTLDVDVNIFVPDERLPEVVSALQTLGITVDLDTAVAEVARQGMFVGWWGRVRVDVFAPSIAFSWEALRTRVPVTVEGSQVYFLSAEALTVFKLLFFRTKDRADLERLMTVMGPTLDHRWVRANLVEMMGDDDDRVRFWDELTGYVPDP